jgi:hypothetical protein
MLAQRRPTIAHAAAHGKLHLTRAVPQKGRSKSSNGMTQFSQPPAQQTVTSVDDPAEPLLPSSISSVEEEPQEQTSQWTQLTLYKVSNQPVQQSMAAGRRVAGLNQFACVVALLHCRACRLRLLLSR